MSLGITLSGDIYPAKTEKLMFIPAFRKEKKKLVWAAFT